MTNPSIYQPPMQKHPKKRHIIRNVFIGIGAVIGAIIAISVIVAIADPAPAPSAAPASPRASSPATTPAAATTAPRHAHHAPGLHQAVRDGDFAFTVERVSCGASAAAAVDADGVGETVPAGARECIVTIRVADDKGSAQTFFDGNQYAYDKHGRQYSADSDAGIWLHGDEDAAQVNPGIAITALVPFQIPAGDRLVRLVLHDSAFSGGVTVRL